MVKKPKLFKGLISSSLAILMSITLFPTLAFADTTQDGDNQQGITGQDVSKDYRVDPNAFGCWRIYMAHRDGGAVVGQIKDVGKVDRPDIRYAYNGSKLQTQGRGLSQGKPEFEKSDKIPPLGSSMATLKAYWEADNYASIKGAAETLGWGDDAVQKFISGEYVIVMEPVAWFTFGGELRSMSATEIAVMNSSTGGRVKKYLGSFTHNQIPGYAWLEGGSGSSTDGKSGWWGIPPGYSYDTNGMRFWLDDKEIISTFGISVVHSNGGMCCAHSPTDCACYKNATPPNHNPSQAPSDCRCFKTHLKDPSNPIPCAPGVPGCDCYPPQCCAHPPSCPCEPGKHPDTDPSCECPKTHPGAPCGPDVPDCDCYPDEIVGSAVLRIKEDEMTQALNAKMEAKGTKFTVKSIPAFQPRGGTYTGGNCSCRGYTSKGKHK